MMARSKTNNFSCPSRRCPCDECKASRTKYRRDLRRSQGVLERQSLHGGPGQYGQGCRCDLCVEGAAARKRQYRETGTTVGARYEVFDETYGGLI